MVAWIDWAVSALLRHRAHFNQRLSGEINTDLTLDFIHYILVDSQRKTCALCVLSQGKFCGRAPSFVVDILWDHLVLLQQDVDRDAAALKIVPSNLCKTLTDPVSMPRLPPSPLGA